MHGSFLQPGLSIKALIQNLKRVVFEEIENLRKNWQKVKKVPSCEAFLRP